MKIEHVFNCCDILLCGFSIMQLNPHLNWICKLAVMAYLNSEMYIWSILYLLLSSFINKQCNLGVGKDSGSHNIQYLFKVKKRWHISCRSWEVCNSCIIAGVLLQLVTQCREMFRVICEHCEQFDKMRYFKTL